MKKHWEEILISVFMGLILPTLLLNALVTLDEQPTQPTEPAAAVPTDAVSGEKLVMRLRNPDGSTGQMDMDTYLAGVVAAEMPASFDPEALKAQAVVARTYTLKAYTTGGKHGDGSVCTDHTCCQAYTGQLDSDDLAKISAAVTATSGQVLTFEGNLIEATYFSCSGGSTEDAIAVWGTDYPYLRATESPGEEQAAHYTDTVTFTYAEFSSAFGGLSGDPKNWVGFATYTAGGGVHSITIGGKTYKGTEIRSLLSLRSTAFSISVGEDSVIITTKGYGHRVGMSQYGADAMAAAGSSYAEILAHYYQGTELTTWTEN